MRITERRLRHLIRETPLIEVEYTADDIESLGALSLRGQRVTIGESKLRQLIRESLLAENLAGFVSKTQGKDYRSTVYDPTFEKEPSDTERSPKSLARSIKTSWKEEADHAFMDSLVKVHWFKLTDDWHKNFVNFMGMSRKNEISTMGYLPGDSDTRLRSMWGECGVIVKGRTTLAANSMNAMLTGYSADSNDGVRKKYSSSGLPKRSTFFASKKADQYDYSSSDYILDRESFDASMQDTNELIVDNWKPVGFVTTTPDLLNDLAQAVHVVGKRDWRKMGRNHHAELLGQALTAIEYGLPIYDQKQRMIPDDEIQRALKGEYYD